MNTFFKNIFLGLVLSAGSVALMSAFPSPKKEWNHLKLKMESLLHKKKVKKSSLQECLTSIKTKLVELNRRYHILPAMGVLTTAAIISYCIRYLTQDAGGVPTSNTLSPQTNASTDTIPASEHPSPASAPVIIDLTQPEPRIEVISAPTPPQNSKPAPTIVTGEQSGFNPSQVELPVQPTHHTEITVVSPVTKQPSSFTMNQQEAQQIGLFSGTNP